MPSEPPDHKPKRPAASPQPKAAPKCRRCQSVETALMGRMEKSQEALYRCRTCGFVFTSTSN